MPETSIIDGYHAHIYYDERTRAAAAEIRQAIDQNFTVKLGRWREEPVGPHPQSMYQVAFEPDQFEKIVPWLMLNRQGLDVLVHPSTDDSYTDHAIFALWLGEKLELKLDIFDKSGNS